MISAITSSNILDMHVTKIIFFFFQKSIMGMLGTIFGIEIVMMKNTFSFHWKDRDNTYIKSSFLNVNHAWNDLKFYKL